MYANQIKIITHLPVDQQREKCLKYNPKQDES